MFLFLRKKSKHVTIRGPVHEKEVELILFVNMAFIGMFFFKMIYGMPPYLVFNDPTLYVWYVGGSQRTERT